MVPVKESIAMSDSEPQPQIQAQRLCTEIQLFDLCELEVCRHKVGRFCADPELLGRFEKIAEKEVRPVERYISEEDDSDDVLYDDEDGDFSDDDDASADEEFEEE
jgi:hypothetical protein